LEIVHVAAHQTLHDIEVVVLMDGSLAVAADALLAVVAEVLQLATVEAAVNRNDLLRKVVAVHYLLGVQVHAAKLLI
jgi:hypothetical protein